MAHSIDLPRSRARAPKEISSETDSTPPPRRRQAENPTTARSPGHRPLADPVITASNIHYEVADQDPGDPCGGIGAMHLLVRKLGLAEAIDERLHLLKIHFPYHESDHVLNFAYNALCDGTCLDDIELRRNDSSSSTPWAPTASPTPPPPATSAAASPRRRRDPSGVFDETRLKVWQQQPPTSSTRPSSTSTARWSATGASASRAWTSLTMAPGAIIPLVVSLANTGEVLSIVNRSGNRPSHEGAAEQLDLAILLCRRAGFLQRLPARRHRLHPDRATGRLGRRGREVPLRHRRHAQSPGVGRGTARIGLGRVATTPQYTVKGPPRKRPENIKDQIVRQREFETLTRLREDVAEVAYRRRPVNGRTG